jgi:hypothetical protein
MKLERILTTEEICKERGKAEAADYDYMKPDLVAYGLDEEGGDIQYTILSLGDTFPTGRCECGHRKDFHNLLHPCMVKGCKCPLFKPSLGKVVGIERINPCCKICGKPPHEYMGMHNYETVGEVKWKITLEVD